MAKTYFEGFENGNLNNWNVQTSNFGIKTDRVYEGTYSAGINQDGAQENIAYLNLSNVIEYDSITDFEFYWQESSSSTGGGIRLEDSIGNIVSAFATDNPEWYLDDGDGQNQIYGGDGYDRWIYVKFSNIGDGTYDYYIEDLSSGTTRSGTRNLNSTNKIETIYIKNFNSGDGGWASGNIYMRFDSIKITYEYVKTRGNVFMLGGNKTNPIAEALNDATIAAWNFDDGSGDTVFDEKGSNDGSINGATWTTGKIGDALSFDGSDDYVDFGINPFDGIITDEWTLATWFYYNASTGGEQSLISCAYSQSSVSSNNTGIILQMSSDETIQARRRASGTFDFDNQQLNPADTLSTGNWYRLVYTRKANNSALYLNGQLIASNSNNPLDNVSWNTNLYSDGVHLLGADYNTQASGNIREYTNGKLDGTIISNTAWTQDMVDYDYNNGAGKQYPY